MGAKKIAVLVSGGGTNLQALIDAEKKGSFGDSKITLVLSSKPDVYALERARAADIPAAVIARRQTPRGGDRPCGARGIFDHYRRADV